MKFPSNIKILHTNKSDKKYSQRLQSFRERKKLQPRSRKPNISLAMPPWRTRTLSPSHYQALYVSPLRREKTTMNKEKFEVLVLSALLEGTATSRWLPLPRVGRKHKVSKSCGYEWKQRERGEDEIGRDQWAEILVPHSKRVVMVGFWCANYNYSKRTFF